MIHFYHGPNDFAIKRQVDVVTGKFATKYGAENISRIDAGDTEPQQLMAEIVNINLFMPHRLVVLSSAANSKTVWAVLGENLSRVPDETELVIIEPNPDKRTKTFKELKKVAETREFPELKDHGLTEFVLNEAADQKVEIKRGAADELIIYTGGDPWRIASEIAKFRALDKVVTPELVHELVEPDLEASAFQLLDDLLNGRRDKALGELAKLRQLEDANKFLGLLSSQVFALAAAANAGNHTSGEVASDMGVHPFVMSKMCAVARRLGKNDVARIVRIVAETDTRMKSTGGDPWTLVELALVKI